MLFIFFFNDTATTEIYTLSLHDALPISDPNIKNSSPASTTIGPGNYTNGITISGNNKTIKLQPGLYCFGKDFKVNSGSNGDRKSTRLNSSHANISYAVFCLKKKKKYSAH